MTENLTKIFFEYEEAEGQYGVESAWAEPTAGGYKLDNLLFYAKEYALGDVVEVEEKDGAKYVTGLLKESGHSLVRVLFHDLAIVQEIRNELAEAGCQSELSNLSNLIAVDIPASMEYAPIRTYLEAGEADGRWTYQEACIAHQ